MAGDCHVVAASAWIARTTRAATRPPPCRRAARGPADAPRDVSPDRGSPAGRGRSAPEQREHQAGVGRDEQSLSTPMQWPPGANRCTDCYGMTADVLVPLNLIRTAISSRAANSLGVHSGESTTVSSVRRCAPQRSAPVYSTPVRRRRFVERRRGADQVIRPSARPIISGHPARLQSVCVAERDGPGSTPPSCSRQRPRWSCTPRSPDRRQPFDSLPRILWLGCAPVRSITEHGHSM